MSAFFPFFEVKYALVLVHANERARTHTYTHIVWGQDWGGCHGARVKKHVRFFDGMYLNGSIFIGRERVRARKGARASERVRETERESERENEKGLKKKVYTIQVYTCMLEIHLL